jgi:hypothetical protein
MIDNSGTIEVLGFAAVAIARNPGSNDTIVVTNSGAILGAATGYLGGISIASD